MEKELKTLSKWMDVKKAARYLDLHPATLYSYVQRKQIPCHRIPGSNAIRFSARELDEWIMGK